MGLLATRDNANRGEEHAEDLEEPEGPELRGAVRQPPGHRVAVGQSHLWAEEPHWGGEGSTPRREGGGCWFEDMTT